MKPLILLSLLVLIRYTEAFAWPSNSSLGGSPEHSSIWKQPDYQPLPQNSYQEQREMYNKPYSDTYRNGPLLERRQDERSSTERQREDTYRGDTGIDKCHSLYGCQ